MTQKVKYMYSILIPTHQIGESDLEVCTGAAMSLRIKSINLNELDGHK